MGDSLQYENDFTEPEPMQMVTGSHDAQGGDQSKTRKKKETGVKSLKDKIKTLTDENERYKNENAELTAENERIMKKLQPYQPQFGAQLTPEEFIMEILEENRTVTNKLSSSKSLVSKLKIQLCFSNQTINVLQEQISQSKQNSGSAIELQKGIDELRMHYEKQLEEVKLHHEQEKYEIQSNMAKHENDVDMYWKGIVGNIEKEKLALQQGIADKDVEIQNLRTEIENYFSAYKLEHKEFEDAKQNFKTRINNLEKDIGALKVKKDESDNLASKRQNIITQKERDLRQYQQHIQQLQTDLNNHITTIKSLEKEKKDLTLRLSKLAGANLTYNNPNIADLSDESRPTKLAEEFSELYDNEWTDAFEALDIENEREKTQIMLNILKSVSRLCQDTSRNHMDAIKNSLSTLVIRDLWAEEEEEIPEERVNGISASTQGSKTNEVQNDLPGEPVSGDKPHGERSKPDLSENNLFGLITRENQDQDEVNAADSIDTEDENADNLREFKGVDAASAGDRNTCDKTTGESKHDSERDSSHVVPVADSDKSDRDLHEERPNTAGNEMKKSDANDNRNKDNKKSGSSKRGSKNRKTPYPITLLANFEELASEQKKTILEIRKYFEQSLSQQFYKVGSRIIEKEIGIDQHAQESIVKYIKKCMTICWSMCRHEPPVHIEFLETEGEKSYDTNMFKAYTKTGKHLDFVVWPALYLHEGGPLLAKGVAQGRK